MEGEPQVESGENLNPGEVLQIRFQKKPNQKLKYLEAEPKILGVTQIVFGVFIAFMIVAFYVNDMTVYSYTDASMITGCAVSMIIIIAGSLAIAAQNLHLPTLKACLGMQVVACMASVIFTFLHLNNSNDIHHCWMPLDSQITTCRKLNISLENCLGLQNLVMMLQVALSTTLAAYCCKVIQCCSPVSRVPVITINRPPETQ